MDERLRSLKGSLSRDEFKLWHKSAALPKFYYMCDCDGVLVEKRVNSITSVIHEGIVAFIDYKQAGDSVSYTEAVAYNQFVAMGFPVFLVWSKSPEFTTFTIQRYNGADPRPSPPVCDLTLVAKDISQAQYVAWEKQLRDEWYLRVSTPKPKQNLTAW